MNEQLVVQLQAAEDQIQQVRDVCANYEAQLNELKQTLGLNGSYFFLILCLFFLIYFLKTIVIERFRI